MNVIVVDDEQLILQTEAAIIRNVLPDANVTSFSGKEDALEYALNFPVDIAFLDINLELDSGLLLAKSLQAVYPKINIIFCTGYSEYSLEALELYCSAYLMKPVTEEKVQKALANLRYPVPDRNEGLFIRCFGHFDVLYNGIPVKFKYAKTEQMLAFLIDQNGAMLGTKELMAAIFENDDKDSYIRNIKADLVSTFQSLGVGDLLVQEWGRIGVDREKIHCDYYDYLRGSKHLFRGEYMSQYSLGELTLAQLMKDTVKN